MKKIHLILMVLSIFILSSALGTATIEIDHDEDDCVNGWISMDVTVTVDGEDFDFNPSCSFSFDDNFTTEEGLECEVEAGMCSGFSPQESFEVSCSDGSEESVDIECPED